MDQWQFITCIYNKNDGTLTYMVNAIITEKINLQTDFSVSNDFPLIIGRHFTSASGGSSFPYPLKGSLDEIRIYGRVLNNAEIQKLYFQ